MKTLECSSKGDKRFCSYYAFVEFDGKYKSIETHLQDCKRNEQGYPSKKGEWATHVVLCGQKLPISNYTAFYRYLWYTYFRANPDLVDYAADFKAFTNQFRGNSKNCPTDCIKAYIHRDRTFYYPILAFCKKLNIEIPKEQEQIYARLLFRFSTTLIPTF